MRVLVVDDEADIRLVVQACLDHVEVIEARDGPSALTLLAGTRVDAILLDVMMPAMNGFEVLARIREMPQCADVPVVILTAKAGESDHVAAFRSGADAYLTKPFELDELLEVLDRVTTQDAPARAAAREEELGRAELLASLESHFGF